MPAAITQSLVDRFQEIYGPSGFLNKHNIARQAESELLGLSVLSGVDAYFLGDPGVGKTYIIELMLRCIDGAHLFDTMLLKDMSADDLLGPRSLNALKQDRLERLTTGFLPSAHVGYVDEWDKGNATTLNGLLDLTANRKMKVGGKVIDCGQLLAIIFSGNAMPDREDLTAITDRLGIKKFVQAVRSPEQQAAVIRIQIARQNAPIPDSDIPKVTLDEIAQMREEIKLVSVPEATLDKIIEALDKFREAGFPPSTRKVGQCVKVMRARAWARGSDEVSTDDMIVMKDMVWNHPDHARKAEDIIVEFASEFTRKAKYAKEALEPISSKMNEVKQAVDAAGDDTTAVDDALGGAYELMRQLRRLRRDTRKEVKEGQAEGHDTAALEDVLSEIDKAEKWATETFTGAEDE